MSLFDGLMRAGLPLVPRRLIWVVARRYVAGPRLSDALEVVSRERAAGFGTILDVLGEHVESTEAARAAAAEYHRALETLGRVDPGCGVSVKPTHLGLGLDVDLCAGLLSDLCEAAAAHGHRVRFEMEDAPTVDATLAVFNALRGRHANLGCVLQSRLFRSAQDVERLLAEGPLDVRLVKGIYIEPPSIAWTEPEDISRSFVDLARRLFEGGAFVGLATHDEHLANRCLDLVGEPGRGGDANGVRPYEFQCLLGVRAELAAAWRDAGHPVRIYVPYGEEWHAYSMRRLTRNPQIARHVLAAILRRRSRRSQTGTQPPSGPAAGGAAG
jgi:proline dehydrogenase